MYLKQGLQERIFPAFKKKYALLCGHAHVHLCVRMYHVHITALTGSIAFGPICLKMIQENIEEKEEVSNGHVPVRTVLSEISAKALSTFAPVDLRRLL